MSGSYPKNVKNEDEGPLILVADILVRWCLLSLDEDVNQTEYILSLSRDSDVLKKWVSQLYYCTLLETRDASQPTVKTARQFGFELAILPRQGRLLVADPIVVCQW